MYKITLINKEDIKSIIPLLEMLDNSVDRNTLEVRLDEMIGQGYQCVGVYDQNRLIGISGLWVLTKYYVGKHIEPDNVFVLPEYQGMGIGGMLFDWIFDYANSIGCNASELNCYINNDEAHKFWKNLGYEIKAYHFQKKFNQ